MYANVLVKSAGLSGLSKESLPDAKVGGVACLELGGMRKGPKKAEGLRTGRRGKGIGNVRKRQVGKRCKHSPHISRQQTRPREHRDGIFSVAAAWGTFTLRDTKSLQGNSF